MEISKPKKKAVVALSGGVDSSICALLLKQQGYDVIGLTGKMTKTASADKIVENARKVAENLGIKFEFLDVSEKFEEKVIKYFENSYAKGETPNPCAVCNKFIKWGELYDYANIIEKDGIYKLFPAKDEKKDQLYFLFSLSQEQLKHTLFPLSSYTKPEIKELAKKFNLPSKDSKESQDICFIQKPMTTKMYLQEKINSKKGDFIELSSGKKLGEHDGFFLFTIGQRKGIGIAAEKPLYVVKTDPEKNIVYLGFDEENSENEVLISNLNWFETPENKFEAMVKIRYNMQAVKALIEIDDNKAKIIFKEPVKSITKGQSGVIYDINDGHLIGGGWLCS